MSDHVPPCDRSGEWADLRRQYLRSEPGPSTGGGVHHVALLSRNVPTTIEFYQGILGFPLTELFENRDYPGSTHFFFDIGNGNALAFFDFPGLDLGPYQEVLGGLHHLAISVAPERWAEIKARLIDQGVSIDFEYESSLYFNGPDGERIELIADPLGHMYGTEIGASDGHDRFSGSDAS